jgi:hypothetical protein
MLVAFLTICCCVVTLPPFWVLLCRFLVYLQKWCNNQPTHQMADSLDALLSRASPGGRQASAGRRAPPAAIGGGLPSGSSGSYGSSSSMTGMGSMGPPVTRGSSIGGGPTPHTTPARGGSATSARVGVSDPYATPAPVPRNDSFSNSSSAHNRNGSGVNGSNGSSAFGASTSFSGTTDLGASQTIGADGVRHGRRAGSAAPKRPELGREPSGPPTPSHSSSATSAPSPSHAASPAGSLKMRCKPMLVLYPIYVL